jgi:hypothetical protein
MISRDELQRRLLPPPPMPPPPPPSQFQGLLNLAGDPNVPEAIRTSAGDAANKHRALATKAGMDPHEYRSGGEAAEGQGKAERTPEAERRQPKPQPTLFGELARRAQGPPGQAPGPEFPVMVPPPQAQAPGPGFPIDTGGHALGPSFPVGPVPQPPRPRQPDTIQPTFGDALSGGLDVMGSALALPPGGRPKLSGPSFPIGVGGPAPDLGLEGVAPQPFVGGTSAIDPTASAPGPGFPISVDSPQKRGQEFDARRHALGAALTGAITAPFKAGTHYDEARQEQVANDPGPPQSMGGGGIEAETPESPNDARMASQTFPLRGAPGIPVSKPTNIPAARPKSKAGNVPVPRSKPNGFKIEDGAPGPLGTVAAKGESSEWEFPDLSKRAGGIEKTLEPTKQIPPDAGNATAGAGGSTAADPNAAPTYSREAEALKPIEPPKPINPLAYALIKGGAALMASKSQFGQALGEGVGAGIEGYVDAQNMDFENLRKANEDQRASRKEAREEYTDTQLKRWIAGKEVGQGDRGLDIRSLESDRTFNLGERGIAERGREADQDYQLGVTKEGHDYDINRGQLGIAGTNARTAQGNLRVAQAGLGLESERNAIARQTVTPNNARELYAYTQQLMETYPDLKANPTKAYEAAQALFLKMNPAPAAYGGLDQILAGQQRPPIAEGAVGGAVPR